MSTPRTVPEAGVAAAAHRTLPSWSIGVVGLVGLGTLVASVFRTSDVLLAVAVLFALGIGIGWPHYLGIPAKKTLAAVIGLTGAGSAVAASFAAAPGYLNWTPGFIALGVTAVFLVQVVRGTGQAQRLESTLGCCVGVLLSCLGSGWIAGARFNGVKEMVLVAGISAAVALLTGLIRWPDRIIAPLGITLAGLAGPLAGLVFSNIAVLPAAVFGVLVGAVLVSFRRLVTLRGAPLNFPAALGMGLAPIAAVGSLAYFIDKLLIS